MKKIIDKMVIIRYFLTIMVIFIGIVDHKFCIAVSIIACIFYEIYWYLWRRDRE